MLRLTDDDLVALGEVNRLRRRARGGRDDALERRFASRFGADRRLAVYGSLAPGRSNHDQLAGLAGAWTSGLTVRGELSTITFTDGLEYPGLHPSGDGPPVPVELFVSEDLPAHWPRLDAFEGSNYRRVLVPVWRGHEVVEVANLYEAVLPRRQTRGAGRQ